MIIGISAKMGCGKTTLALHLQNLMARDHAFGEGVPVLRAFGDPLKQEAAEMYGFDLEDGYTTYGKGKQVELDPRFEAYRIGDLVTVRELLQFHGTDYRRAQNANYWTKAFDNYVAQDLRMGNHLIVHDVRFENEASWVLDRGGVLLRMAPYKGWKPGEFADHKSETALDDYPFFTQIVAPGFGQIASTAKRVFRFLQGL